MSRRSFSSRKLALLSLLIVCAVLAEQIIVTVNGVDVHEKKLSMSAIVVTLKSGDQIQVIERGADGWLHISVEGKEGFVKSSKIEEPKGGGFGDLLKNPAFTPRTEASDPTASAAARGLKPGAIVYSQAKNLPVAPLNSMIDTRRAVVGPRFDDFTKQGNVGPQ